MSLWIRLCNHTYIHTYSAMHSALDSGRCTVPGGITISGNGEADT